MQKNFSHKFKNGITLTCDPMTDVESVTMEILFKVGSRDEDEKIAGISHCIEHMLFKGTKKRTAKDISEEVEKMGAHINAYTSHEMTGYHIKTLKENTKKALDILRDITHNPTHLEKELAMEKGVIINEILQSLDDPSDLTFMKLQQEAFKNHEIGRPIAGTVESVKSLSRDDMLKYMDKYYTNENVIISLAGNINIDEVVDFVGEKFDYNNKNNKIYSNNIKSKDKGEAHKIKPVYAGGNVIERKEIEQVHVCFGFMAHDYRSELYYIQQAASMILGGGMSSRLFQEIREKRGLAYSISSFVLPYTDCGIFGVYSITQPQFVNQLVDITLEEISKLSEDASDAEVEKVKMQMKSSLLMAQESTSRRAGRAASSHAIFGRYITVDEILAKINNINKEEVKNLIKEMLKNTKTSSITTAIVGNEKGLIANDIMRDKCRQIL